MGLWTSGETILGKSSQTEETQEAEFYLLSSQRFLLLTGKWREQYWFSLPYKEVKVKVAQSCPTLCDPMNRGAWQATVHRVAKSQTQLKWLSMHTHISSTLAWKILWTEEPGRLQSVGLQRVRHDWATSLSLFTFMHWRRKWQPTPVFLPGESQGRGSLVGCRPLGCTESDTTEVT